MVASQELVDSEPALVEALQTGVARGYTLASDDPEAALDELLSAEPGLEPDVQVSQMDALTEADAFSAGVEPGTVKRARIANWRAFAKR